MTTLRPYQQDLVSRARLAYAAGRRRILIQLPTGGGKTHIISEIARAASLRNSRVLVMAHRIEIVDQIIEKLTIFGLSPDVIASGRPSSSHQLHCAVAVAMQQTLVRRLEKIEPPDILIVDEAHHQAAKGYQKIVSKWPKAMVIGLTATPARLDGKPLKEYFDELLLGPTVRELIDAGALADYTYLAPPVHPDLMEDLKSMKKVGGDYAKGQMEAAVSKKKIVGDAIEHYRKYLNGKPVLAFCASVNHGKMVSDMFTAAGFRSESVDGNMKKPERDAIIQRFRDGLISVLVSCDLIGEGFDVPDCAGVLLMRPTASLTIFLQQVGRALRPKADGSKAVILDHVGNCYKHGQPDDVRDWSLEGRLKKNKVKISQCPKCYAVIDPEAIKAVTTCPSGAYDKNDCPYMQPEEAKKEKEITMKYVDGELVPFVRKKEVDWCPGIDVKTAQGMDWTRLLRAAGDNRDRLGQLAQIRNYKRGWVEVRLTQANATRKKYMRSG